MATPEIVEDLEKAVKKNPALGIAGAVILFALLFYLYERGKIAAAPAAASAAPTGFTPAMGTYTFAEDIHQTPTPGPVPVPIPTPTPKPPPIPKPPPVPKPPPTPGNPIFGVTLPLPAPAHSSVQFGSIGNVGQRVYVTLPSGQQYNVYGDTSSQLPRGTTFKPGGNNSWWYVVPGRAQAYLVLPG